MNEIIRDAVIRLYRAGRLSDAGLETAVAKGWLTREEADGLRAGA